MFGVGGARSLVARREVVGADVIGDQVGGGAGDVDALDAQFAHPFGDALTTSGGAQAEIGRRVVADQEHQLHEVEDGERDPRIVEQATQRAAPRGEVGRIQLHHPVEGELAFVHASQQLYRDRHLVSARHRERLVRVQEGSASALEVDCGEPHAAAGERLESRPFIFERRFAAGLGDGEGTGEERHGHAGGDPTDDGNAVSHDSDPSGDSIWVWRKTYQSGGGFLVETCRGTLVRFLDWYVWNGSSIGPRMPPRGTRGLLDSSLVSPGSCCGWEWWSSDRRVARLSRTG